MATKPSYSKQSLAELRALNYMVRVLIVTHPDREKLAAAIARGIVQFESSMLATTIPDDLIALVKEHMLRFRALALGKRKRDASPSGGPANER